MIGNIRTLCDLLYGEKMSVEDLSGVAEKDNESLGFYFIRNMLRE